MILDKRLDPCDSTPCLNGGTCHSNNITFTYNCTCPVKQTGTLCETGSYFSK